jgi:hypothetical protein
VADELAPGMGLARTAVSFSRTLSTEAGLAITGTVTLFRKVS